MVLFPNAKINFGLNILRKRDDGYHELETIFYPIGLKDGLEFIENEKNKIVFSSSGLALNIDPEENIVVKAYRLLAADHSIPGIDRTAFYANRVSLLVEVPEGSTAISSPTRTVPASRPYFTALLKRFTITIFISSGSHSIT